MKLIPFDSGSSRETPLKHPLGATGADLADLAEVMPKPTVSLSSDSVHFSENARSAPPRQVAPMQGPPRNDNDMLKKIGEFGTIFGGYWFGGNMGGGLAAAGFSIGNDYLEKGSVDWFKAAIYGGTAFAIGFLGEMLMKRIRGL